MAPDSNKILAGLVVFLFLVTSPFWYNMASGQAKKKPELQKPAKGKQCVLETVKMRENHMQLLNDWRDQVVRDGNRSLVVVDGMPYEKSLSNTCLDCHTDQTKFCQECHDYVGVDPYCWDCHVTSQDAGMASSTQRRVVDGR